MENDLDFKNVMWKHLMTVVYMWNGLVLSRNHRISEIMKLEASEPIEFIEISRYTKEFLEFQTDEELIRLEHMLNFLKQAQNQNA